MFEEIDRTMRVESNPTTELLNLDIGNRYVRDTKGFHGPALVSGILRKMMLMFLLENQKNVAVLV
jgi:hypothetical protein